MAGNGREEESRSSGGGQAGLLVTADGTLARAFRQELQDLTPAFDVDVREDWCGALQEAERPYSWVAIDVGCGVIPADALRLARLSWPGARVAAVTSWWCDELDAVRPLADVVIHKPLRSAEVADFLAGVHSNGQGPTGAEKTRAATGAAPRSRRALAPASPP